MGYAVRALVVFALLAAVGSASAQDIEPRAYSDAPVNVNFLIAGDAYTRGGIPSDSELPITNPSLHASNAVFG
jgi:hypothetical protein